MICKQCGFPLNENDKFCKKCGSKVENQDNGQGMKQSNPFPQNNSIMKDENLNTNNASSMNNFGLNNQNMNNLNMSNPNITNPSMNNQNQSDMFVPNNFEQPSLQNQPNNYYYQMPEKKSTGKYIIIGVLAAVALVAITVGIVLSIQSTTPTPDTSGNTPEPTHVNNNYYKVKSNGFTYSIPEDYIYENQGDTLMVADETGTWVSVIQSTEGNYEQLKSNKGQLQAVLQKQGINSSAATVKNYNGVEFIVLEISQNGQNFIMGYTRLNSMNIAGVIAYTQSNEFDYSVVEKTAPIISTAQYDGTSSANMMPKTNFDISKIEDLAK